MCGIIGYIGNKKASDVLIGGLKRLEYRGYDSAGICTIENKDLVTTKCAGKVLDLEKELKSNKTYREFEVDYNTYLDDLKNKKEDLKFSDLELIFRDLKSLFEKRGFIINWKALEKQSLDETINALAMASPFSLEEKQVLLEAINLDLRKNKIAEILTTYTFDEFNNTTAINLNSQSVICDFFKKIIYNFIFTYYIYRLVQ